MTTISTSPAYPTEGDTITITVVDSASDTAVIEITSVPPLSTQPTGFLITSQLDTATTEAVPISASAVADELAAGAAAAFTFAADRGGQYGVTVWEMRSFGGAAAAYLGDPVGAERVELQTSAAVTIDVGVTTELTIRTASGSGASLLLQINGDNIRAASLVKTTDDLSRLAALETSTVAAVAALVGVTVDNIANELPDDVNNLVAEYELHIRTIGGVHSAADALNTVTLPPAQTNDAAIALLADMLTRYGDHATNGAITGLGVAWHVPSEEDRLNLPLAGGPSTLASAIVLSADLRHRCYERHRQHYNGGTPPHDDPQVHVSAEDATNVLTTITPLESVIVAFFDALADLTPTAASGESQGATDAANRLGFVRT